MNRKGLTLVELIAVIVIIAILMTIAVPASVELINGSKKSAFNSYIDKLRTDVQSRYESDLSQNPEIIRQCIIYNIKTELGLADTGEMEGYIVVTPTINGAKYYFNVHNDRFMVVNFNYDTEKLENATTRYKTTGTKGFITEDNMYDYLHDDLSCYDWTTASGIGVVREEYAQ